MQWHKSFTRVPVFPDGILFTVLPFPVHVTVLQPVSHGFRLREDLVRQLNELLHTIRHNCQALLPEVGLS